MAGHEIAALIQKVAEGDRVAFATLYRTTSPKLFSICLRILRDRTDAEEALQEVYLRIWRKAAAFQTQTGNGWAWVATIARNHAIDVIRARQPVMEDVDERIDIADEREADPERQAALRDEGRRIDECMRQLQSAQADAVRRAYVEGLSYVELAQQMDVPLNTIRTWLRRSLIKLRECMQG